MTPWYKDFGNIIIITTIFIVAAAIVLVIVGTHYSNIEEQRRVDECNSLNGTYVKGGKYGDDVCISNEGKGVVKKWP